ncbi:DUF6153 family protein [Streptomyces phaeofaciens]|uniref:DUF6153 family protein n=1 Tax=Streptomyces phaeofaciens TaxID=68254 RepID=UPI00369A460D
MNGLWRRAVCVLGLLVGLLAMHGLAPGVLLPHSAHPQARPMADAAVSAVASFVTSAAEAHDDCPEGHCGGGHARHADPTCASPAPDGGPVLAGPVPDPAPVPVTHGAGCASVTDDPDGARAPPSLAELQLLRI